MGKMAVTNVCSKRWMSHTGWLTEKCHFQAVLSRVSWLAGATKGWKVSESDVVHQTTSTQPSFCLQIRVEKSKIYFSLQSVNNSALPADDMGKFWARYNFLEKSIATSKFNWFSKNNQNLLFAKLNPSLENWYVFFLSEVFKIFS